jgi:hypothetical protein
LGKIQRKWNRKQRIGLRALEIAGWSFEPRICDCFYCARGRGNNLQAPAATCGGAAARYSLAWGSWYPRSPNARNLHPTDEDLSAGTQDLGHLTLRAWGSWYRTIRKAREGYGTRNPAPDNWRLNQPIGLTLC